MAIVNRINKQLAAGSLIHCFGDKMAIANFFKLFPIV